MAVSDRRAQRMADFKIKCERISTYLSTGKHVSGLNKNEQRTVRAQSLRHIWDSGKQQLFVRGEQGQGNKRTVTNEDELLHIIRHYHSKALGGHSGINATLAKISHLYAWNGIKEDIKDFVMSCDWCQRFSKIKTQAPQLIPIKVKEPLELVGMDLIGPLPLTANGNKYICTFTDYFTKFVDFFPLKEKAAEDVSKAIKSFVCRWGAPERLLSDQGKEFVAKINDQVCKKFGINQSITSAYYPQCNGLDKRTNQTLKHRLSKLVNENKDDWDCFLEEVAYSMRIQKQESTKFTPFFLMFHRHPRDTREMSVTEGCEFITEVAETDVAEMVAITSNVVMETQTKVQENVEKAKKKDQESYAKRKSLGVKTFQFKTGDLVLRKKMRNEARKGGEMEAFWCGPYRIDEIDSNQRVALAAAANIEGGVPLTAKVPYEQLKPYLTQHYSANKN